MRQVTYNRNSERGNSLIEFALGFSFLWLLFAGIYQFGHAMLDYNILATAVHGGARYASRLSFDDPDHDFVGPIKNMVIYGTPNPDEDTVPMLGDLTFDNVDVSWTRDEAGVPQTVTVALNDYAINAFFTKFDMADKPRVTVRYAGVWKTTPDFDPDNVDDEDGNSKKDKKK